MSTDWPESAEGRFLCKNHIGILQGADRRRSESNVREIVLGLWGRAYRETACYGRSRQDFMRGIMRDLRSLISV